MVVGDTKYFRTDIQVLRGLAVMLVVVFHTKLGYLKMGYLGVDIFFVISGFLITTIVARGLAGGTFSFREFYFRRAKRLLPAAYATLVLTTIAAPWLLTDTEMRDFLQQLFGALAFCANLVLWNQTGYFSGSADIKPLLHMWSLSIEEQYYFVMPLLLFMVPARWRLGAVIAVLIASLAYCFVINKSDQSSAFYLLPTRAWEMALGSVGAILTTSRRLEVFLGLAFWPALAILLIFPFIRIDSPHPGFAALIVCAATLVVILRRHPGWESQKWLAPAVWAGNVSYSLYLVHWPIIAFFNNAWIKDGTFPVPFGWRMFLLAASLISAHLIYRFIELPVRQADIRFNWIRVSLAALVSLAIAAGGSAIAAVSRGTIDYAALSAPNFGLDKTCAFTSGFNNPPECRTSASPKILVWGDSFAMHLVPGLITSDSGSRDIVQATMSLCGPTMGLARIFGGELTSNCIAFNDSVASFIKTAPSIDTIIISTNLRTYFYPGSKLKLYSKAGLSKTISPTVNNVYHGLARTVALARKAGKKIVFISPTPTAEYDIARCQERAQRHLPILSHATSCQFPAKVYRARNKKIFELYERLERDSKVNIIRLDQALCETETCKTHVNGVPLFRDYGHLSYAGSTALLKDIKIGQLVKQLAK